MTKSAEWFISDGQYRYEYGTTQVPDYQRQAMDYANEVVPENSFDLTAHLNTRATSSSFSFVEFGHRATPIAPHIPDLSGTRTYIGIESWLRDRSPYDGFKHVASELRLAAEGTTAAYLQNKLSGKIAYDPNDEYYEHSWYDGEYDPETILPDDIADELFMGNVLCDPQPGWSTKADKDRLLREAARLLTPSGILVARETITSREARISRERYRDAGLTPVGYYGPHSSIEWRQLELAYQSKVLEHYSSSDHYLFLQNIG